MTRQLHGQWLREQRQTHGWPVSELRRRLRQAAEESGDRLPSNEAMTTMIYRWENDNGGISERYRLYYCRVLGIPYAAFGKTPTELQPSPLLSVESPLELAKTALSALTALIASLEA